LEEDVEIKRLYQGFMGAALIGIAAFFFISIAGYNSADYTSLNNHAGVKHIAGPMAAWISHILRTLFGIASYLLVVVLAIPGMFLITNDRVGRATEKSMLLLFLTVSLSAAISMFIRQQPQLSGGYAGQYICDFCNALLGTTVTYILLSAIPLFIAMALGVLFLAPRHEKYEKSSSMMEWFRQIMRRLPIIRNREEIPLLTIGKIKDGKKNKFPWIIKKRIIVYETEKIDTPMNSLLFPELPDPSPERTYDLLADRNIGHDMLLLDRPNMNEVSDGEDTDVILGEDEYIINSDADRESAQSADESEMIDECPVDNYDERDMESREMLNENDDISDGEDEEYTDELSAPEQKPPVYDTACPADFADHVFDEIPINEEYIIPTSFLTSSKPLDSESWKNEIRRNSILLKNTLAEFSIEAEVTNVNRGPVITLYEMQIAPGIKVNRIVGLADDIAMALAAQRVRIVAPIPGKSAIGVEIPNRYRETVTLGDIVKSEEFQTFEGSLAVALGKDILGNPVIIDLKRLPHLLIAGTTGSGKSVCVNSIITSLVYNYDPNHVRFILVDPKMVELQLYNGLPHLLTPVIVDPMVAPMVLKWTMHEMERRYCLLSEMNTRDIERYNEKIKRSISGAEKLPYIVVIIDEMADLMMSSKEVEGYITRIAQKSRAVGIHLVVATQRPSVDIITGIIKANFPARIAFQVAQKTDSRTIIDQNGAEKLLGRGDMLYQPPTSSFPIRVQGGFISEEEVEKIANHLCKLGKPSYIDIEESLLDDDESKEPEEETDDLFQEALKIIEETKKASASYLQRRLSIGYNRAARIIEQMEDMGYIGPQIGSKPREVFV
jgi:hypothetical protein